MSKRLYLTESEINILLKYAKKGKHSKRNHCIIFMAYRHGLRISEALSLRLSDIDLNSKQIHINRLKNGFSTIHPLDDDECNIISDWYQDRVFYHNNINNQFVFLSEKGTVLSRKHAWYILRKIGGVAGINVSVHPHMLRHSCGYALANKGVDTRLIQDYLGHRNIRHTVHYTKSNPRRFATMWNSPS